VHELARGAGEALGPPAINARAWRDHARAAWPLSVAVFDRMRRQDAQVASVLRAVTSPIIRTQWRSTAPAATTRSPEFVASNLGPADRGRRPDDDFRPAARPRPVLLGRAPALALLMLPFGHCSSSRSTATTPRDGQYRIRKLGPRLPRTISRSTSPATAAWSRSSSTARILGGDDRATTAAGQPARGLRARARGRQLARPVAAPLGVQELAAQGPGAADLVDLDRPQRRRHPDLHRRRERESTSTPARSSPPTCAAATTPAARSPTAPSSSSRASRARPARHRQVRPLPGRADRPLGARPLPEPRHPDRRPGRVLQPRLGPRRHLHLSLEAVAGVATPPLGATSSRTWSTSTSARPSRPRRSCLRRDRHPARASSTASARPPACPPTPTS
jgi:hypothetical protein